MSEVREGRPTRRGGGRAGRVAARSNARTTAAAYLTRLVHPYEIVSDEGLEMIEFNADTILEEVGIEFRDHPRSVELFRDAGCDVDGTRVRFPRGMCRQIVSEQAPSEYLQHARNPARTVLIGGNATVFAPAYGSPFVFDLDGGRRYATIEDVRNLVKHYGPIRAVDGRGPAGAVR